MPFDPNEATQPKTPSLKFGRLNDAVKLRITAIDDDVTTRRTENGVTTEDTNIVIRGEVLAARGGDKDDNEQYVDSPIGSERALWLRYQRNGSNNPSPLTTACSITLKQMGVRFAVGGVLTVIHDRMGEKPTNSTYSRAKLYTATYTPPDPLAEVAQPAPAANLPRDFPDPAPPAPAFDPFLDS